MTPTCRKNARGSLQVFRPGDGEALARRWRGVHTSLTKPLPHHISLAFPTGAEMSETLELNVNGMMCGGERCSRGAAGVSVCEGGAPRV